MDENLIQVQCPYCGEWQELAIDPESTGRMVQDCEVCCGPWDMTITKTRAGAFSVNLRRLG